MAFSGVQLLFGQVLGALVNHCLAEAVEPAVLVPKVGRIVRTIGSGGAA